MAVARLYTSCGRDQGVRKRHADCGADGIHEDVCDLKRLMVGEDFGAFLNCAQHGDESSNQQGRFALPAQAISKGDQRIGWQMCDPMRDAGKCLSSRREAASDKRKDGQGNRQRAAAGCDRGIWK